MLSKLVVCYLLIVQLANANNLGYSFFGKRAVSSQSNCDYPIGCSPQATTVLPGLNMELYFYPIVNGIPPNCYDASYVDPEYPRTGYLKRKMIGKSTGVTGNLNFKYSVEKACMVKYGNLPAGYNYNEPLTVSNFTMLLYGYFKPQTSGIHTFFVNADDLLYINFGAGNAFDCCKREDSKYKLGEYVAYDIWHVDSSKNKVSLNLEKDVYYPIRMFFNNIGKDSSLDLSFSVNGAVEHITDFSGYLYSVPDQPDACPAPIGYDTTCRSIDSTTTYSTQFITTKPVENVLPITSTIYYIATPCSQSKSPTPSCEGGFIDPLKNTCYYPNSESSSSHMPSSVGPSSVNPSSHNPSSSNPSSGNPSTSIVSPLVSTKTITLSNGSATTVTITVTPSSPNSSSSNDTIPSFSLPPPYTTTVSKSTTTETDIVSFFPSTDSDGHTRTGTTTITLTGSKPGNNGDSDSFSLPPPYTTTVSKSTTTETDIVSFFPSTDSDGHTRTGTTTITLTGSKPGNNGDSDSFSLPPPYTTTVSKSTTTETDIVSFFPSTDSDGHTRTGTTTITLTGSKPGNNGDSDSFSLPPPYTTTVSKSTTTETDIVSFFPSTDSDGHTRTGTTTITLTGSKPSNNGNVGTSSVPPVGNIVITPSVSTRTVTFTNGIILTITTTIRPPSPNGGGSGNNGNTPSPNGGGSGSNGKIPPPSGSSSPRLSSSVVNLPTLSTYKGDASTPTEMTPAKLLMLLMLTFIF
ncbi:hypothetical protein B1J92_K00170g4 [Nakaseomyces glabratus]|nr:hypothetical protein B1J91_K00170g4 [Nakaseomyces glabratus]OXB50351.1 hypothetical protein B1J92_K00170g4 [Nakaseomyces glabratus]